MAFSADLQQGGSSTAAADGDAEDAHLRDELAEERRAHRATGLKLEQKERELEHALGLRRKLGGENTSNPHRNTISREEMSERLLVRTDATRKIGELRAMLDERDQELHELRGGAPSPSSSRGGGGGADALAMEEMSRELEQLRSRVAAADAGQRKAQERVRHLAKTLDKLRQKGQGGGGDGGGGRGSGSSGNGDGWASDFDRVSDSQKPSSSPASWVRAALDATGDDPDPDPEEERDEQPPLVEDASFDVTATTHQQRIFAEMQRRLEAGELNVEEERMVRMQLANSRLDRERLSGIDGRQRTDAAVVGHGGGTAAGTPPRAGRRAAATDVGRGQVAKPMAGWGLDEDGASAGESGSVAGPEELLQRRLDQVQARFAATSSSSGASAASPQETQTDLRAKTEREEQQAAIVHSWGRMKEGEEARQRVKDTAQEHRLGWLKAGQVMQKYAWSSQKVQPRYIKLAPDSSAVLWGSPGASKLKQIAIRDIRDVYYGFTSAVFRKREQEVGLHAFPTTV